MKGDDPLPIGTEMSVQVVVDASIKYLQNIIVDSTLRSYRRSYENLKSYYKELGLVNYSVDISNQYVTNRTVDYNNGLFSRRGLLNLNRAVVLANQYFESGVISLGAHLAFCNKKLPSLSQDNQVILDTYAEHMRKCGLKESSIQKETYDIALFLRFIHESEINDLQQLTSENVVKCIPYLRNFRQNIGNEIASVRRFLNYLVDYTALDKRIPNALYVNSTIHKKIIYGFTTSEAERILAAVDRTSAIGKRDYAIMLLAHETGLRCIDIKNICLSDIDWRHSEMHIVSSKNQKPKVIKIMKNVGDAIADYQLNGRPQSDCLNLFLSTHGLHGKLLGQLNGMVKKYAKLSGVDKETKAVIGMHAFRRGLGVSMLDAEVPLSVISEVLDHTRHNTTKRYLAISKKGLEICVMPMGKFLCEV